MPLWNLIGITFFLIIGSTSVAGLGHYVNIYYVNHGDLAAAAIIGGWKATVLAVTGILCIPLYTWLGERFDKKATVLWMLGASILGHTLNVFLITPSMPYLQLIPAIFESCALSAVWLFIPSMKGDISDYDELTTTRRREGSLNACFSWFVKAAFACATGLGGLVLEISGFNVTLQHEQPQAVLHRMLWIYVALPIVLWGISFTFVVNYRLDRSCMSKIRETLEKRRGVL